MKALSTGIRSSFRNREARSGERGAVVVEFALVTLLLILILVGTTELGRAWYTVETDDAAIEAVIEGLPSSASMDYGAPFGELFERYEGDFYKIDPLLFSPAEVALSNARSGRTFRAGRVDAKVLTGSLLG